MKRWAPWLGSVLSGLLLWLSWPEQGWPFLAFFALVPLLWALDRERERGGKRFFGLAWLAFALWNGLTAWWIALAHWSGLVAVVFIAAAVEALAVWAWKRSLPVLGIKRGWFALIGYWMLGEWLLRDWDLNWPWLALGNVFATRPEWVQWYSVTGIFGGSLWVLIVNILAYKSATICIGRPLKEWPVRWAKPALVLLVPLSISLWQYFRYEEQGDPLEVIVVQPNIDAYTEKFEKSSIEQLQIFLDLAEPQISDNTRYVVGPETLIPAGLDEDRMDSEAEVRRLRAFYEKYPHLNLVMGANTVRWYESRVNETCRPHPSGRYWYDVFNTGLQINSADSVPLYHKSRLVVGAEKMPFLGVLGPILGNSTFDFGGISGTNRTQDHREIFVSQDGQHRCGTIICWENEFGEFVTGYVKKGSDILFVITNDGWWGNSEGHRQHLHYARLRAIENRRAIGRSANTGISALINQRGDLMQTLGWEQEGVLKGTLYANREVTLYSRYGDVLLRLSGWMGMVLAGVALVGRMRNKKGSVPPNSNDASS